MSNKRYIKTYIDNEITILTLNSCNTCPFMITDYPRSLIKCAKFKDDSKIFEPDVIMKSSGFLKTTTGCGWRALSHAYIPDWCDLAKSFHQVYQDNEVFFKKAGMIDVEASNIEGIKVVSDEYVVIDEDDNLISRTPSIEPVIPGPSDEDDDIDKQYTEYCERSGFHYPQSTTTTVTVKKEKLCSFCKEEKEEVDRGKHYGMCSTCWNLMKKNKKARGTALINNFRLKRNIVFSDTEFKIAKEFLTRQTS